MQRVSKFGENERKIWRVQGYEVIFSFNVERMVNYIFFEKESKLKVQCWRLQCLHVGIGKRCLV